MHSTLGFSLSLSLPCPLHTAWTGCLTEEIRIRITVSWLVPDKHPTPQGKQTLTRRQVPHSFLTSHSAGLWQGSFPCAQLQKKTLQITSVILGHMGDFVLRKATVTGNPVKQGAKDHFVTYENKPITFWKLLKEGDRMLWDSGKELQYLLK